MGRFDGSQRRRIGHTLMVATAACLLLLAGCGRGGRDLPGVGLELLIEPSPPRIGPARVIVTLTDEGGQAIEGARIEMEGNMSHAGMVPVLAAAKEVAPGRYQADLEFTMGGDWFILVRAELPDGRSLERSVDVPGVDVICGDTPAP
jgi:hypothetical protein